MDPSAFSFSNVTKIFGQTRANDGVSFAVAPCSIHGVVGENGAGKSTILKILYGLYRADEGDVFVGTERVDFTSPQQAIARGIGMVHQHFMLVPTLTVWQNVILGREPYAWHSNYSRAIKELSALQAEFGFSLNLEARIEDLPVGLQQQVEILKLLYRKASILIFDEPTAVLTPQEVGVLIARLKSLRDQGKTIVFISHKLKEILALTENVTILRQGKVVGTWPTHTLNETLLAERMIGRKMQDLPARRPFGESRPLIEAREVTVRTGKRVLLDRVSFHLKPGEIVGVAGIDGNGQQELMEILAHVRSDYEGTLTWKDQPYQSLDAYAFKQKGLAVIPADRHREAVVLDFNLGENALLGHHRERPFVQRGRLRWGQVFTETQKIIDRFDIRPPLPTARMGALSGGNQQKLVVGRELARPVEFLLASHPTRGVDIGAIERIHREILRLREEGTAVLLFSSELDEILALSDRLLVIANGKIQGECTRAQASETQIGLWMTGDKG
jgi:simple sugar transport system ATP-binding protein